MYSWRGSGSILYIGHSLPHGWSITQPRWFRYTNSYQHRHTYGDDNTITNCHSLCNAGWGLPEENTYTIANTVSVTVTRKK
jgi:hypothetical protein